MPKSLQNSQWVQIYQDFLRKGINTAQYAPPGAAPTANQIANPAPTPIQVGGPPPQDQVVPPLPNEGGGGAIADPDPKNPSQPGGPGGQPPPATNPSGNGTANQGGGPNPIQVISGPPANNPYEEFLRGNYGLPKTGQVRKP